MTKEDAISLLKQVNEILINSNSWLENTHEPLNQAFDMAIKALEQQPSGDCMSRAEVNKLYDEYRPRLATHVSEFGDKLKALPPVTPTFPKCATNDELNAKIKHENLQLKIRNVDLNDTINTFNKDIDRVKEELDRLTVYYTTKLGNELLCKKAVKRIIDKYLGDYYD